MQPFSSHTPFIIIYTFNSEWKSEYSFYLIKFTITSSKKEKLGKKRASAFETRSTKTEMIAEQIVRDERCGMFEVVMHIVA